MSTETSKTDLLREQFDRYVIPNYSRFPLTIVRGEGSYVWDADGNRYLDLFPGWGCNLLGHCPSAVVQAVGQQVQELIHVPNTCYTTLQGHWAQLLSERSFGGQAFFCNSGTEANEAALKLSRLHTPADRYKIITFTGGFHGRTLGSTAATAQPKYHEGLGPLMAGFRYAPFGDLDGTQRLVDDETAAILVEPVQGEGGVNLPPEGFLAGLRQLADDYDLLLIFDEVQTGCGRTGEWFAYQHFDVVPDIMTLAKSLCGGIAGAAMLTTAEIARSLRPGMHAATFGGNPVAAAAGIATLETIEKENLLSRARALSTLFRERLEQFVCESEAVREVRILGLMIGIEIDTEGERVVEACLKKNLLVNCTQDKVIRLLPAMTLTDAQAHEGCDILTDVLKQLA